MDNKVVVSKGTDPYRTAWRALQHFSFKEWRGRNVLIKPNGARLASPGEGVTTHPRVVEALVDYLLEQRAGEVAIGESCIFGVDSKEAFLMTGLKGLSERKGVELIDLDQAPAMEMPIPGGKILKKIKVPVILKRFDSIVSVPVMKTHMHTRVTLSLKNMKGALWRREKARLHQLQGNRDILKGSKALDLAISDMALVLFPHFSVIDGITGMEGMGPSYGAKKKAGLIVAGNNPVCTDAVAARLMGFKPEEIPHLYLSAEKGLGEIQLDKLSIEPKSYLKWQNRFVPPPTELSLPFPDLVVHDQGSCSACLSTLFVLLHRYYGELTAHRLRDDKIHLGIGKHLEKVPGGTILIGNCTHKMKRRGIFVRGCPPVASEVMRVLS
jgi:uncharacterized protein (DUF362 family)